MRGISRPRPHFKGVHMYRTSIAAALLLVTALPLQAQSLGDRLFERGGECFRRVYSNDHLKSHPLQNVAEIAVGADVVGMRVSNGFDLLNLYVRLRDSNEVFTAVAYCDRRGANVACQMEGDAGGFGLREAPGGQVRLVVGREGMSFEGARNFITFYADSGDDRVFLLPPGGCP